MSPVATAISSPELEHQPHARAVIDAALAGAPNHAYLFHGPEGVGKAAAARAFAAELLAAGGDDAESVRRRVAHGTHPDLAWVEPRGAHGILVEDIRERVVGQVALRPFEGERRVFVIESADQMNAESANALLKTLEEPPRYAHLILLSAHPDRLPQTVRSRCQAVRFRPLPEQVVVDRLRESGSSEDAARALARLAGGNLRLARFLASGAGAELREAAQSAARAALAEEPQDRPWRRILALADGSGKRAQECVMAELEEALESMPKGRGRGALKRDYEQAARRAARRESTTMLEFALAFMQSWFRDLLACAQGAENTVLNLDRVRELREGVVDVSPISLAAAAELCEKTRRSLRRNVDAELALEALLYRLQERLIA